MIPAIASLALFGAWGASLLIILSVLLSRQFRLYAVAAVARPLTLINIVAVFGALFGLIASFINQDFHVVYVAAHSAENLPIMYRIAATWGGHEGSLLLWISLLQLWVAALLCQRQRFRPAQFNLILAICAAISFALLSVLVWTSSPFIVSETLLKGRDLNPLLQDPGLVSHPPILYMGYVGYAMVFAITFAALWEGKLDRDFARKLQPYALLAWSALSLGITLGSLWAYRELGWGGYWFWDPVENAALMPWLAGVALLHILRLVQQQNSAQTWLVSLVIMAFSLSLLGTFLVRSGVMVSVHSFASDPTRGVLLLICLACFVLSACLTYAYKMPHIQTQPFSAKPFSRLWAMFMQSLFMMLMLGVVMLGTLYPMILSALGLADISVGAPYFETVLAPILILMMGLMAVTFPLSSYSKRVVFCLGLALSMLLSAGLLWVLSFPFKFTPFLGLSMAMGILLSLVWVIKQCHLVWPAILGHLAVAVMAVGLSLSGPYAQEKAVILSTGDHVEMGDIDIWFESTYGVNGPNYRGVAGKFRVYDGGQLSDEVVAEKRIYLVGGQVMTDAGISAGVTRDVYIALGQPEDEETWSVHFYVKPFVRWIWAGGFLMAACVLVSVFNRKRRQS